MEDRYSLQPYFAPEQPEGSDDDTLAVAESGVPAPLKAVLEARTNCSYCGVFDGHSAAAAADIAALRMHKVLAQQLAGLAQCAFRPLANSGGGVSA